MRAKNFNELNDIFASLKEKEEQDLKEYNPIEQRDITRSKIANLFVWGFLILIVVFFFVSLLYNIAILSFFPEKEDLILVPKDMILLVTSIIGTPLGFVVGYYFKQSENTVE